MGGSESKAKLNGTGSVIGRDSSHTDDNQEVVASSGFHFMELHMPSAGVGLGTILGLVGLMLLALFCCHKCGCINVSTHKNGKRNRRSSGDSDSGSRRRAQSPVEALQEMMVVSEMKQIRDDAQAREDRKLNREQQQSSNFQQAPMRQQSYQPQIDYSRHEPLALPYNPPERHIIHHSYPEMNSTSFTTSASSTLPRHRDPPVYGTLPKAQVSGNPPHLSTVHRPVEETRRHHELPYPHLEDQRAVVRQHRANDTRSDTIEEASQTASHSDALREETRAMLRQ